LVVGELPRKLRTFSDRTNNTYTYVTNRMLPTVQKIFSQA
jgi:hypothetical protein